MGSDLSQTWVLPSEVTAVVDARRHVAAACRDLPTEKVEIARLLVTELVANAVQHGLGPVVLAVTQELGSVRVEVHDESPEMPVVLEPKSMMEHGAGLRLVATLASSWGTSAHQGRPGKRVWFVL